MSRFEFRLPDVGEGLVEAEIVAWHVAAGDRIVVDQPLLSVETDKAVVEIPAPRSGQIVRCVGELGDRVEVGDLLVELDTEREAPGAVVGELTEHPTAEVPVGARLFRQSDTATSLRKQTRSGAMAREPGAAVRASPAARRRARELGVDLALAEPSGPGGVVQVADVEAAPSAAPGAGTALKGVRRAMARRMAAAGARVVPATVTGEADISAWPSESRPMVRLIQAVVSACEAAPQLNAAFDDRQFTIAPSSVVNLGLAMETDVGLFVPVLGDAGRFSAAELAVEVGRLEAAVGTRQLAPDALSGQTITLSNFGAVAGRYATMVVVPPQVAIVGAGRAYRKPMLDGDDVRAGRALPLSVTFDHRAVTGVEACGFLDAMIGALQKETVQ